MSNKRILIVDDDETLITALDTKFQNLGYDVTIAIDGQEAITFLNDQTFDVLLTDLHMPNADGFAVLKALKESDNKAIPAFVITNLGSEKHCREAIAIGAKECFVKSQVSLKDVVDKVHGV